MAEHAADNMHNFVEQTGRSRPMAIGAASAQIVEHLNHDFKSGVLHTNQHVSKTNIDDNKFKQVVSKKFLNFAKVFLTEVPRNARNFAFCQPCAEEEGNGDQVSLSQRCTRSQ